MIVSILIAASENNVIGKNNTLPWHLPNDLKFFKNTTWGMPIIMGRKTFESMGSKPLRGRINIIISRQQDFKAEGVVVVTTLNDAMSAATETDCKEVFIVGGSQIFKETIKSARRIYMTRIHTHIDGDIHFTAIDDISWKCTSKRRCFADEKHAYDYTFELWERREFVV